ncbi:MAG: CDP-alcohol phosphatidyltransferase family protein [Actinomycetaceae bacterium]|nr:CDP-alcohol phosphatidyltransferase family protein [Actinomycetaceae bacterium]
MLSSKGRSFAQAAFGPIAKVFVKAGISADAVTITGTVAGVALALWLLPTDHLASGSLAIGALALFDSLDGQIARLTGTSSKWGAFLDSTLDRVTDAAIFIGLFLWAHAHAGSDTRGLLAVGLLGALVTGSLVPYVRARAEGLGMTASVGIAERADRLVIILVAALLVGLNLSQFILVAASWYLFIAGIVTVIQRMAVVHQQAHEEQPREEGDEP